MECATCGWATKPALKTCTLVDGETTLILQLVPCEICANKRCRAVHHKPDVARKMAALLKKAVAEMAVAHNLTNWEALRAEVAVKPT